MERIISDEEKIKRAIEISQRRNQNQLYLRSTTVNVNPKKDYKLFKRMILQIIICLLIYCIFYLITTTNYIFSRDVIEKTSSILNYDINFHALYLKGKEQIKSWMNVNTEQTEIENINEDNIVQQEQSTSQIPTAIMQMEQDAMQVKKICDFKIPLKGTITSEFRRTRNNISYYEYRS